MSIAEDKLSIMETITTYFFALDALNDPTALASTFTPDAVWECFNYGEKEPAIRLDSLEQMEQLVAMEIAANNPVRLRHHQCGVVFKHITAETALTHTKVLVTAQQESEPAPRVRNTALCEGQWRKTEQGWKLARWTIRRDPAA